MRLPEWSDPDRRDAALRDMARRLAEPDPLNRRELAVLFLDSHGVPASLQAEWLHLSQHTIYDHARRARHKLFAATTTHAVATALRLGLFE